MCEHAARATHPRAEGGPDRLWPWLLASVALHALLTQGWQDARIVTRAPAASPEPTTIHMRLAQPPPVAPAPPEPAPPPPEPVSEPPPRPRPVEQPRPPPEPAPVVPPTPAVSAAPPATVDTAAVEAAALQRLRDEAAAADRLAAYIREVRARIESHKRYPSMARRRAIEGLVVIRIEIGADGRVAGIDLDGRAPAVLSRATRQAVERAGPFPVPPQGALSVEIPIRYDLDG